MADRNSERSIIDSIRSRYKPTHTIQPSSENIVCENIQLNTINDRTENTGVENEQLSGPSRELHKVTREKEELNKRLHETM